jgi:hypothetical protein
VAKKKSNDPRRLALLEKLEAERAGFEKGYSRMKRALTKMDKHKQRIVRLARQLDQLDNPPAAGETEQAEA